MQVYFETDKMTCSERTNSRKASRGGSVSTHINRHNFDSVQMQHYVMSSEFLNFLLKF